MTHAELSLIASVSTVAAMFLTSFAAAAPATMPATTHATTQQVEARVEQLLSQMTPEEKLALVHADSKFSTAGVARLGVPARWLSDGPHGVREDVGPFTWDSANGTDDYVTAMPALLCLAASFDTDLARRYGEVLGEEARARGKDILLGPSVNIHRSPLCGRNFEYMGEDPLLTADTCVAYIQGLQSRDVAACVKHFAMNNEEQDRGTVDVHADDRTLREIYLPAFEAAVKQGGVLSVMGAYNLFRGQHCCHNELLLNQILKGEWGFKGLVVSDWSGVHDTREAALYGMDLEMGSDTNSRSYDQFFLAGPYLDAIRAGQLPMAGLDDKARRNLYVMARTNMLPNMFESQQRAAGAMNTKAHQRIARDVAEAGMVLLKNDRAALPLDATNPPASIAVIGDFATRLQSQGGGAATIKAFYEVSPLAGLVARVGDAANVTFSQGYKVVEPPRRRRQPTTFDSAGVRTDATQPATTTATMPATTTAAIDLTMQPDEALIARAVLAAKAADVAVVIAGTGHARYFDAEGADRRDLRLPYGQDELIRRVAEANPRTVVVLLSGGPVDMPWLDRVPAVVQMWYGGMEAGNALARVLFGDVDPSGKLPCTWPKKLSDSPAHALDAFPGRDGVVEYKEGIFVGYRWFDERKIEPLFPFGHGLSYTSFDCGGLQLQSAIDANGAPTVTASVDVTNTGKRAGAAVVQAYVHDVASSLPRPPQELKGYAKVALAPGETKRVTITLPPRSFAFYDPAAQAWVAEAGTFEVRVGFSSRDVRQTTSFELAKTVRLE